MGHQFPQMPQHLGLRGPVQRDGLPDQRVDGKLRKLEEIRDWMIVIQHISCLVYVDDSDGHMQAIEFVVVQPARPYKLSWSAYISHSL